MEFCTLVAIINGSLACHAISARAEPLAIAFISNCWMVGYDKLYVSLTYDSIHCFPFDYWLASLPLIFASPIVPDLYIFLTS